MYEHRLLIAQERAEDRPLEIRRATNAPETGIRVYRQPSRRPQARETRRWWR